MTPAVSLQPFFVLASIDNIVTDLTRKVQVHTDDGVIYHGITSAHDEWLSATICTSGIARNNFQGVLYLTVEKIKNESLSKSNTSVNFLL